jgi:hypothetical protein
MDGVIGTVQHLVSHGCKTYVYLTVDLVLNA